MARPRRVARVGVSIDGVSPRAEYPAPHGGLCPRMRTSAIALARAVAVTSGREALRRAWPAALAITVAGAVFFGPNGLTARDVGDLAAHHRPLRAALWMAWLALAFPAARALLRDPSLAFVRAQPVSPARLLTALTTALALGDAPWAVFRARAFGALDALSAAVATVVAQWALAVPPRRAVARIAAVALGGAIVAADDPRALLAVALAAGAVIVPLAWRDMAEPLARDVSRRALSSHPSLALAQCHLRALTRTATPALLRALGLSSLCAALLHTVTRHRASPSPDDLASLAMTASVLPAAVAGVTAALVADRTRRALADLVAGATSPARAAAWLPTIAVSSLAGVVAAAPALVVAVPTAHRLAALGAGAAWSASSGVMAAWVTSRVRGRSPTLRIATWMLLVAAAQWTLVASWGARALWVAPVVAALSWREVSR